MNGQIALGGSGGERWGLSERAGGKEKKGVSRLTYESNKTLKKKRRR